MQAPLYPYSASYPREAATRSRQHIGQIIIGTLLGVFPLLIMWAFAFLSGVSTMFTYNVIIYSFPCTSLIVMLIAVPFLFLKGRRWVALALAAWVLTIPGALISALWFAI
jgi:hypothetical protein